MRHLTTVSNVVGVGLVGVLFVLAALGAQSQPAAHAFQERILVGIDADPDGNTATSLGAIDACISVESGQIFDIDVFVANVNDLAGWQTTVIYDSSLLRIVDGDVRFFVAHDPESNLLDLSEPLPNQMGSYTMVVADFAPIPGESGDGVLGRLTMEAVGAGISDLRVSGTVLVDSQTGSIEDFDGDSLYDGATAGAKVSIDAPCPEITPVASPEPSPTITEPTATVPAVTPSPTLPTATPPGEATATPTVPPVSTPATAEEEDSDFPWVVVGAVAGGLVAVAILGLILAWRLRRA